MPLLYMVLAWLYQHERWASGLWASQVALLILHPMFKHHVQAGAMLYAVRLATSEMYSSIHTDRFFASWRLGVQTATCWYL
jgi:hypothetical protein